MRLMTLALATLVAAAPLAVQAAPLSAPKPAITNSNLMQVAHHCGRHAHWVPGHRGHHGFVPGHCARN